MLDHVDPLLAYLTGFDNLYTGYGERTDALAELMDNTCDTEVPRSELEQCLADLALSSQFSEIVSAADSAFAAAPITSAFDQTFDTSQTVGDKLYGFKKTLSSTNDRPDVQFHGPEGRLITQMRFSHEGVHELMAVGSHEKFQESLEGVLRLMAARRSRDIGSKTEHLDDYIDDRQKRIDEMVEMFAQATVDFANFDEISDVEILGDRIGDHSQIVSVDGDGDVTLAALAEHKGDTLTDLLPELASLAESGVFNDLDEPGAFVVGYAMLWSVNPSSVELLANAIFDEDDRLSPGDIDIYARGQNARLIDAGQFDLDILLKAE